MQTILRYGLPLLFLATLPSACENAANPAIEERVVRDLSVISLNASNLTSVKSFVDEFDPKNDSNEPDRLDVTLNLVGTVDPIPASPVVSFELTRGRTSPILDPENGDLSAIQLRIVDVPADGSEVSLSGDPADDSAPLASRFSYGIFSGGGQQTVDVIPSASTGSYKNCTLKLEYNAGSQRITGELNFAADPFNPGVILNTLIEFELQITSN